MSKVIRYLTLVFGLAYSVIPIYMNYESLALLMGQVVFFLISITPFFAYFFFSRKENNLLNLLLPSVPICVLYALLLSTYFDSTSSTSALVFIVAPIIGFGLLITAYLILYLISKFKTKTESHVS
ncbi:MAG: hypothetical protein WCK13_08020 [Ignavibacteriota bacterium]